MRTLKRFAVALLASAFALSSFAATLTPIQLLNPAGSTSGQVIASTGASTAPAWTTVTLSGLSGTVAIANGGTGATTAAAARTNLGLGTAAIASTGTSGATIPLLSTANTWTLAQAFTVRPTFNGATPWDSTNLPSPVTAASPTFTGTVSTAALTATGLITPSSTIGIKGTATNDSAQAGSVGERFVYSTTGTSLTSSVTANCASTTTPLSAGDWDVSGYVQFVPASGTTTSGAIAGISTTSAAIINYPGTSVTNATVSNAAIPASLQTILPTPVMPISLASATVVYLVGNATFAISTMTCSGVIRARRVR